LYIFYNKIKEYIGKNGDEVKDKNCTTICMQ